MTRDSLPRRADAARPPRHSPVHGSHPRFFGEHPSCLSARMRGSAPPDARPCGTVPCAGGRGIGAFPTLPRRGRCGVVAHQGVCTRVRCAIPAVGASAMMRIRPWMRMGRIHDGGIGRDSAPVIPREAGRGNVVHAAVCGPTEGSCLSMTPGQSGAPVAVSLPGEQILRSRQVEDAQAVAVRRSLRMTGGAGGDGGRGTRPGESISPGRALSCSMPSASRRSGGRGGEGMTPCDVCRQRGSSSSRGRGDSSMRMAIARPRRCGE